MFTGTTLALLTLYEGRDRDRVMGWRGTATSLGGVAWPLVGGALGTLSWQAPFAVHLVGVPLGVAALLLVPDERAAQGEPGGAGGFGALRPATLGFCALLVVGSFLLYTVLVRDPLVVALASVGLSGMMSLVGLGYAGLRARFSHTALLRATFIGWTVALVAAPTDQRPPTSAHRPAPTDHRPPGRPHRIRSTADPRGEP